MSGIKQKGRLRCAFKKEIGLRASVEKKCGLLKCVFKQGFDTLCMYLNKGACLEKDEWPQVCMEKRVYLRRSAASDVYFKRRVFKQECGLRCVAQMEGVYTRMWYQMRSTNGVCLNRRVA